MQTIIIITRDVYVDLGNFYRMWCGDVHRSIYRHGTLPKITADILSKSECA